MPDGPVQSSLDQWLYGLAGLLFLLGTQLYAQRKPSFVAAALTACVLGMWAAANAVHLLTNVPVAVPSALVFMSVAVVFWQESRRQETLADGLLSVSFAFWAIARLALFSVP